MNEIEILHYGSTTVGLMAIDRSLPPRQAERAAALAVASELLQRSVTIDHHGDGAPFIADYHGSLSISHSRSTVAVAIDPVRTIGIDIEERERAHRMPQLAPRVLTATEIVSYAGVEELLRAWTLKEAAYKAIHSLQGPSCPVTVITAVTLIPGPDNLPLHATVADTSFTLAHTILPDTTLFSTAQPL